MDPRAVHTELLPYDSRVIHADHMFYGGRSLIMSDQSRYLSPA